MNMMAGPPGTYVISWAQTEIDGIVGAPVASLSDDAVWIWRGDSVRIDGATGYFSGPALAAQLDHRRRAALSARRIVARALVLEGVRTPYIDDSIEFDRTFSVTDGVGTWTATLIEMPEIARPLLLFADQMPPSDTPLFIADGIAEPALPSRLAEAAEGVVCFTPGTVLETPDGMKPVEHLVAGDCVVTKDGGAQPILWAGSRNVSGARLYAMPDLRPVRIREGALGGERPEGDLIVSPDHRMLISGPQAQLLWGETEVLVAARDLVDGTRISRDLAAKSVTYYHLMLEQHHVVIANGVETESFHPAAAALDAIDEDQRLRLFDVMPELADDTSRYGPTSRRTLNKPEAALLRATAA
ncbi:MAG: Hint domain-containing protein [Pseudomonadota bacterium]